MSDVSEKIKADLDRTDRLGTDGGHKRLPELLVPDESVELLLSGRVDLSGWKGVVFAVTDRRLLLVGKQAVEDCAFSEIIGIEYETGFTSEKLAIQQGERVPRLKDLTPIARVREVAEHLASKAGVALEFGVKQQKKEAKRAELEGRRASASRKREESKLRKTQIKEKGYVFPTEDPALDAQVGLLRQRVKRALAENLSEGESIHVVIHGTSGQAIVGTATRAFVLKPGFMAGATLGAEVTSFSYRNLAGVQVHKGMMTGSVLLQSFGQAGEKTSYWRQGDDDTFKAPNAIPIAGGWDVVKAGAATLRQLIDQAHDPGPAAAPSHQETSSVADEIAKLAELKAAGALTEDEFTAAKQRLLDT